MPDDTCRAYDTCSRPDDTGALSCPNLAVAGTTECLEHAEPAPKLHGNGYTGVYNHGTSAWPTPSAPEPAPTPPARPYVVIRRDAARVADGIARLEWATDATEATEAQTAAFRAVDDAFRRNLTAYARAVNSTLEAATRRLDPTTITPELRRTLIARAIGWFRR